jgi:Immunity protein 52
MAERHYVGVYWEDRAASREECASQVLGTLARLRARDPLLSRWYLKRATREETLQAEIPQAGPPELLEGGLALVADDGPELGWKVTVWNGLGEGQSAHADLIVGAHAKIPFSPTPNSMILHMPRGRGQPEIDALLARERMAALLAELARAWSADWGVASTDSYLYGVLPVRPPHHPRVGWLTFLNARRGRAPTIPRTRVTHVDELGYVVGTHDDPFSADDGSAIERVRDMEDALEKASRLHPVGETPGPSSVEEPPPAPAEGTHAHGEAHPADAYAAAVDVAGAVDALSSRIPGRRADLSDALLRASTALVVAAASGDGSAKIAAEMRALLDVTERLFPESGAADVESARRALARVQG